MSSINLHSQAHALIKHPTNNQILSYLPKKEHVKKALLLLTAVTSVISLVPPLRIPGSLAARSVMLLSSTAEVVKPENKELSTRITNISKVAAVTLGIVGLAIVSPALIIASLVADIGIQTIEFGKAVYNKDPKALVSLTCIAIDSLLIGAIVSSSWQLMVAAAAVSTAALMTLGFAYLSNDDGLEAFCYLALSVTSAVSMFSAAKFTGTTKTNSKFTVENSSDQEYSVYNKKGVLITKVMPKETSTFEVPFKETLQHKSYQVVPTGTNGNLSVIPTSKGSYVEAISFTENGTKMNTIKINASDISTQTIVTKAPLAVQDFPTLPLGGNVIW